jgi:hypothetical protein
MPFVVVDDEAAARKLTGCAATARLLPSTRMGRSDFWAHEAVKLTSYLFSLPDTHVQSWAAHIRSCGSLGELGQPAHRSETRSNLLGRNSSESGLLRIRRVDDQIECAAVTKADRCEVTHVAGGQATDAESLGERDDRSIHKPKGKV